MAHFAKIENGIVRQIVVINNEVITNNKGKEVEQLGIDFCKSLYGADTEWLQTSYNGTFRGKYASSGDLYDPELDIFKYPIAEEQ